MVCPGCKGVVPPGRVYCSPVCRLRVRERRRSRRRRGDRHRPGYYRDYYRRRRAATTAPSSSGDEPPQARADAPYPSWSSPLSDC